MNEKLRNKLSGIVINTLEQLAYVFFSRADADTDLSSAECMAASVSFTGPFSGRLTMDMTPSAVRELTANMLGEEESHITTEQQHDALKEAINILCGNLLPEIGGTQNIFNIEAPQIISEGESCEKDGQIPMAVANLSSDDALCEISLFVDEGMPNSETLLD